MRELGRFSVYGNVLMIRNQFAFFIFTMILVLLWNTGGRQSIQSKTRIACWGMFLGSSSDWKKQNQPVCLWDCFAFL